MEYVQVTITGNSPEIRKTCSNVVPESTNLPTMKDNK